jgi:UDP-glucuronate 4-epimerase
MKTILVTGGAGFIGSQTIKQLLEDVATTVVCVDNFDDTYERVYKEENIASFKKQENFRLEEISIVDRESMTQLGEKYTFTHILHLAAKADTRNALENPYIYVDTNITGSLNVLELAKQQQVENLVIASSSSVYGNNPRVPWVESDTDLKPISPYGVTKYTVENLAYTYHVQFDVPVTLLRYFNAYGEGNRPGMVPYIWAEAMLTDCQLKISGDGERRRDYTYIGDVVRANLFALEKPLGYEILNIGYGSPLSLNELRALFEQVSGKTAEVTSRPSHPASVEETYADTARAKELLNWQPEVSHEEGIKRLLEWFTAHRLGK